jgi:hypothetical protein
MPPNMLARMAKNKNQNIVDSVARESGFHLLLLSAWGDAK